MIETISNEWNILIDFFMYVLFYASLTVIVLVTLQRLFEKIDKYRKIGK